MCLGRWGAGQGYLRRVGCVREITPGNLGDRRHVAWGTGVIVHVLYGLDAVAAASYEVCAARHVSYGSIEGEWKGSNLLLVQARVQDEEIGTADREILDDCITGLIALGRVILATVLGAVLGEVGRDRNGRRSRGRARGRNNRGWERGIFPQAHPCRFLCRWCG